MMSVVLNPEERLKAYLIADWLYTGQSYQPNPNALNSNANETYSSNIGS